MKEETECDKREYCPHYVQKQSVIDPNGYQRCRKLWRFCNFYSHVQKPLSFDITKHREVTNDI